jgi:AraC family transcriptional regulator, positive regulator of tynA and feaB
VDTTRPYALGFGQAFRTLSFRFPHDQLAPLLGRDPRRATAVGVDARRALGELAIQHMTGTLRRAPGLSSAEARVLSETLARLVGAALAPDPERLPTGSRAEVRAAFHDAIVRHVLDRCADPALSAARVAAHFRVSVRYVHEVFARQPASFAQTVLERRLTLAALRLRDEPALGIGEAAERAGFGDPSYFARVFRRRFGCTPRDYRRTRGPD